MTAPNYDCEVHGPYPSEVGHSRQYRCPTCSADAKQAIGEWRSSRAKYARWLHSGIPNRYRNRTIENFRPATPSATAAKCLVTKFVDDFQAHVDEGRGIALIGPVGVGKTHLAAGALTAIIQAGWTGQMVAVPALLAELKAGFGAKDRAGDELLKRLRSTQFLVLDDIGAQRGSDWEMGVLHELLDHRYNEALPTGVTANVFDLARYVGDRIADRCRESMQFVEISGESYRGEAAEDEALRTAPPALLEPPSEFCVQVCDCGSMQSETLQDGF